MTHFISALLLLAPAVCVVSGSCGFYDVHKMMCCAGTLSVKDGRNSCCGKTPYDYKINICCAGHLYTKIGFERLNSCCKQQAYDNRAEICCNGVLHTRSPTSQCCGREEYDEHVEICCGDNGIIYPKNVGSNPCGK